jgi:multiple antibiotic resistance protein
MMRGLEEAAPAANEQDDANPANETQESWRSVLFTPLTFPLTVGGTSFGLIVAFAASAQGIVADLYLSVAGLAYAVLTGVTVFAAGHLHRRVSDASRAVLSRVAGILLTAIAVTLLIGGSTRMVIDTLASLGRI